MSMERRLRKRLSVLITVSLSALFWAFFFTVEVKASGQSFTLYCDFQEVTSSGNVNNLVVDKQYIFGSMQIGNKEGITSVPADGAIFQVKTLSDFQGAYCVYAPDGSAYSFPYATWKQYFAGGADTEFRVDASLYTSEQDIITAYMGGVHPSFPEAGVLIITAGASFDTAENNENGVIGYLDEGQATPLAMTTYPENGKTIVEISSKTTPGWYFCGAGGYVLYDEGPNLYSFTEFTFSEDDIVITRDPLMWYDNEADKNQREAGELAITPIDLNVLVKYGDSGYRLTDFEIDPANNTVGPDDDTLGLIIKNSAGQNVTITKTLEHSGEMIVGENTTTVSNATTTVDGMQEIMAMSYIYGDYLEDNEGFTRDDIAKIALGEYIDFHVDVRDASLNANELSELEVYVNLAEKTIGAIYDINVYKTYYHNAADYNGGTTYKNTRLTDFTYSNLTVKINNSLSNAYSNLTGIQLFRIHERTDHTFEVEELPEGAANAMQAYGFFEFEDNMTKLKIGSAKFSKFILLYDTPTTPTSSRPTGGSGSSTSAVSGATTASSDYVAAANSGESAAISMFKSPKTGEESALLVVLAGMMCPSLLVLISVFCSSYTSNTEKVGHTPMYHRVVNQYFTLILEKILKCGALGMPPTWGKSVLWPMVHKNTEIRFFRRNTGKKKSVAGPIFYANTENRISPSQQLTSLLQ